jgi:hypothetical protein
VASPLFAAAPAADSINTKQDMMGNAKDFSSSSASQAAFLEVFQQQLLGIY